MFASTAIQAGTSRPRGRRFGSGWVVLAVWHALASLAAAQTLLPFHAPARPTGSVEVRLHPMENVVPGTPTLVTFGIPFPRGSITEAGLSSIRVLQGTAEIPAHVGLLTPWRHLSNPAIDGQSVRVARIQFRHAFATEYPASELVTVEWGGPARALDVPTLENPQSGWHAVTSGTFDAADGIREPDVYALLPKEVLAQGVLNLKRHEPFGSAVGETRDDPVVMDGIEHWPGYSEADYAFKNNFYTSINEDDPLVTEYAGGALVDYKNDSEPWLYDRSSGFFLLYLKSGFLRPLREAVRSTQFYRSKLYGPEVSPATSAGLFRLKTPNPATPNGGNDAMYAYAECFAYDLWLTGNPDSVAPIHWVAATVNELADNSRWSPSLGIWTERHTSLATLANIVAFEVTGDALYRQTALAHASDYIWHQNGAGGLLPAERLDGGLYHYGRQHGDGEPDVLVASHWMTTLMVDAMVRAYGMAEDPAMADFIIRAARFQATALIHDDEHDFDTYAGALRYPGYMIRFDGAPDVLDGHDTTAINHALDVASSVAWGAYFQHLRHGVPDPGIEAAARDLYFAFDQGVNHWIRPAAPPLGLTAYRVNPPRKFSWEHRPAGSFAWAMNQIDQISPPPTVVITSPLPNTRFTAPADVLIEATASSPNASITRVEFFDGATKIGEDDSPPYTLQWNGVIADVQGHVITAKATTSLGVVGQSLGIPLDVRAPGRPTLTITSPADGAVLAAPADIAITTEVVPEPGTPVARVVFMRGYVPQFTDTEPPYAYTVSGVLHGSHEFEVMAFDIYGGYDIKLVTVQVQSPTPPSVTLTSPAPGARTARGGVLRLAAEAAAPGSAITRVVFYIDGSAIAEDDTPPYEVDYNLSTSWSVGSHTILARAFESNGGFASQSGTFEILALDPMSVAWSAPASDGHFPFPEPILLEATASAPGSGIARIEFYANGQFVGSDAEAPYQATFTPDSVRQWSLLARAVDIHGRRAEATRLIDVTGPQAPTVAITSPADGAILVSPVAATLTVEASVPAASIERVEFYRGSTLLGQDESAPFSFTTAPLELGEHRLTAVAVASTGRSAQSQVRVYVADADAPVVFLTAPNFGGPQIGTFDRVTFAASAAHTGAGAIQRVEFWLNNALVALDESAPYSFEWPVDNQYGYHELQARAFDGAGHQASSGRLGFELIQPPVVALESPAPGSPIAPGTPTLLTAAVTRGTYAIAEVRFFVNDALVGSDASAPYGVDWTPPSPGSYLLSARVFDTRGLSPSSAPVTVQVAANAPPLAGSDAIQRAAGTLEVKVLRATLLGNDTDADEDPLTLTGVGAPLPAGASVALVGSWVVYTAPSGSAGNGSFTYSLSDGPGGHVVEGTVTITEIPGGNDERPNAASIVPVGSDYLVTFVGLPGRGYRVQYASELGPSPAWTEFEPPVTRVAAPNGVFTHTDVNPGGASRFYRAIGNP